MKKTVLVVFLVGLIWVLMSFPAVLAEEEQENENGDEVVEEEIDNDEDKGEENDEEKDEEELEVSEMDIEDLLDVVDEEEDILGEEIDEEEKPFYRIYTLEEAKEQVLESPQAKQVELGLDMLDISVEIAWENYQDMKELQEDLEDAEDMGEDIDEMINAAFAAVY